MRTKTELLKQVASVIKSEVDNLVRQIDPNKITAAASLGLTEEAAHKTAQAALDAMPVIVLTNYEEPQKGDLVEVNYSTPKGVPEGCSGVVTEFVLLEIPMHEYIGDSDLEYDSHRIIQRNGQPVITVRAK